MSSRFYSINGFGLFWFFIFIICFSHLCQGNLSIDGVRYAHIALSILRSDDWIHLQDYFLDLPYANKPPVFFWLIALSFKYLGVSTFAARLVGASFGFISTLLFFRLMFSLYGKLTAYIGVLLLVFNSVFFRSVLDLSFEGVVLCGGILCLRPIILFVRNGKLDNISLLEYCLGLILLLLSKPPFILFVMFPLIMFWIVDRKLKLVIPLLALFLAIFLFIYVYYVLPTSSYLARAFYNQVFRPFTIGQDWSDNIILWLKSIFLAYAPFSLIGLYSLYFCIKKWPPSFYKGEEERQNMLFSLWLLPALFMVFLVSWRAQYLFLPFLSLLVVGSRLISIKAAVIKPFELYGKWLCILGSAVVLFAITIGINVHRTNLFVKVYKENNAFLSSNLSICLDGKNDLNGVPERRRLQLLLDLEFGIWPEIMSSKGLILSKLADGASFLADDACISNLALSFIEPITKSKWKGLGLYQLMPVSGAKKEIWSERIGDNTLYH